ncbi:hypothetical protein [Anthocerotibacter panamensis]|uniref:hypothetical protein n=1 Tax=Anthocerotibacter panamensis TaxID=2857077 RepID=UPI001C402F2F|nr:hypothetical protein [Anthocerotibacter panamensis]
MKYCLTVFAFLSLALPLWANPLSGQVALAVGKGATTPARTGVVYVVPDTPENWLQLNGLAQRVGRWLTLSRQTAAGATSQDYITVRDYNIAQNRLKGMLNRLVLTAQQKAQQTIPISETGQFTTAEAPSKVILVASAQATEQPENSTQTTLAGWWFLRTESGLDLELLPAKQLYQVGIPLSVQQPSSQP